MSKLITPTNLFILTVKYSIFKQHKLSDPLASKASVGNLMSNISPDNLSTSCMISTENGYFLLSKQEHREV